MDKYRKLYNDNLLGTSDVFILKFYYASFKIQQQKGRVFNIDAFLDECIKVVADNTWIYTLFQLQIQHRTKNNNGYLNLYRFVGMI